MQKNNSTGEISIRSDKGRLIILMLNESNDISWLKENIFTLLNGVEGVPVKSSHFATVLKFNNYETGEEFYFKEFLDRGFKDKLMKFIGITRGKRAYKAGMMLLRKGFLTPVPVVLGTAKASFLVSRNFLITKAVPGEKAYQYIKKHFPPPLSDKMIVDKRELLVAAGREIGRLHSMGIFHGDLRLGNIIINKQGSSVGFFLLDNERTRYCSPLSERRRMKNLVQLNMSLNLKITKTDRLRFFNAYIEENPTLLPNKKKIISRIARITQERVYGEKLS
jgi:tRNA A-37 threonylcarbamoyl transferase component Bud32